MAGPVQLNVTIIQNNAGTITTSVITVPLPAGLTALDSGASGGQGQASAQTGFSSVDIAVRNIFKAGVFTDGQGNYYPVGVIQKITWS